MKKNILITGISSGIGKYLAQNMKDEFNIYGISRRNGEIKDINFYSLDLTDFGKIDSYLETIKNIDFSAIILNAGVGYFDKIENMSDEEVIKTINLNTISPILLVKKMIPNLSKKTKIIFIGSIAGKKFFNYGSVYQSSKFALRGFAGSLRNEIKQKVFLINPQFVDTNFFENERVEIQVKGGYKETKVETIYEVIKNILLSTETRFEIDI